MLRARTILARVACAGLLALPTILAFSAGGFFEGARTRAGIAVWIAVAVALLAGAHLFPASRPARVSVAGLLLLAVWTTVAIAWTPLRDPALTDAVAVWLYAGYLLLAVALLRGAALRLVEPALAGGVVVITGYALATRLLPSIVPSAHSVRAGGRLDQPLTYWNALGLVAAIGLVLLLRLASDERRSIRLRALAAGLTPIPGLALYLTFSRGSLAAAAAGVAVLLALSPGRRAVMTTAVCLVAVAVAAGLTSRFAAVDSLSGSASSQRTEGLAVLAITLACCAAAQLGARAVARGAADRLYLGGGRALALVAVAAALGVGAIAVGRADAPATTSDLPKDRSRLATLRSNRIDYWKVAFDGFSDRPFAGQGTNGFASLWLKKRPISETVQDAHSLYIETAVELGVIGLVLLGMFLGGALASAARVARDPVAIGALAAASAFLVHAGLDWDWEMPTVTLFFIALVACVLAVADEHQRGTA